MPYKVQDLFVHNLHLVMPIFDSSGNDFDFCLLTR